MKNMNYLRRGYGRPLLLVHGLGGRASSWSPILNALATERDVIAVDLPGFGETPSLSGEVSVSTLADALTEFLAKHGLLGIDAVGSSMGGRLVLELARRGETLGAVVAFSPGGFWQGLERHAFYASNFAGIRVIRALEPVLPEILKTKTGRATLLAQLCHHPTKVPFHCAIQELRSFANSKSYNELLHQLAYGDEPQPAPFGSIYQSLVIAWGRQDRVCFAREANRALQYFPDAKLRWLDHCGHYPQWDAPQQMVQLILENTGAKTAARRLHHDWVRPEPKADDLRIVEPVQSMPHDSPAL